jgi:hypothetical protein
MIRRSLLALVLLFPTIALAQDFGGSGSIAGTYTAEGRNPDGSAYHGVVTISEKGNRVHFFWEIGSSSYSGDGTRNQDVVTVNWGDKYPVYYLVVPSGELHGTWAKGTALERLIPR